MKLRTLSLFDRQALEHIQTFGAQPTWSIAYNCGFRTTGSQSASARAYPLMRRLERWGLVTRASAPGCHTVWSLTDAGRRAVQP